MKNCVQKWYVIEDALSLYHVSWESIDMISFGKKKHVYLLKHNSSII